MRAQDDGNSIRFRAANIRVSRFLAIPGSGVLLGKEQPQRRDSPFASQQTDTLALTTSELKYDEFSTLFHLTTKNSFSVRASYRGMSYKAAASFNKTRESRLGKSTLGIDAGIVSERGVVQLKESAEATSIALAPEVLQMKQSVAAAIGSGNATAAQRVRRDFLTKYGHGYIQSVTVGGMYHVKYSEQLTETKRTDNQVTKVSGSGNGFSASAEEARKRIEDFSKRGVTMMAEVYGGDQEVDSVSSGRMIARFNEFNASLVSSDKWTPIEAVYIPYSDHEDLRELTNAEVTAAGALPLYYLGEPDRQRTAAVVQFETDYFLFPMLVPIRAQLKGDSTTEIRLTLGIDTDVFGPSGAPERETRWTRLKQRAESQGDTTFRRVRQPNEAPSDALVDGMLRVTGMPLGDSTELMSQEGLLSVAELRTIQLSVEQGWPSRTFRIELPRDSVIQLLKDKRLHFVTRMLPDGVAEARSSADELIVGSPASDGSFGLVSEIALETKQGTEAWIRDAIELRVAGPAKLVEPLPLAPNTIVYTEMFYNGRKKSDRAYACWRPGAKVGFRTRATSLDPMYRLRGQAPIGMTLHVQQLVESGRSNIGCAENSKLCKQKCQVHIVKSGCFVSTAWYDWYRDSLARLGLPANDSFICKDT